MSDDLTYMKVSSEDRALGIESIGWRWIPQPENLVPQWGPIRYEVVVTVANGPTMSESHSHFDVAVGVVRRTRRILKNMKDQGLEFAHD